MSVLALLILASLAMGTTFLIGFIWAVRSGQYEDTSTPSMRVLMEDAAAAKSAPDGSRGGAAIDATAGRSDPKAGKTK